MTQDAGEPLIFDTSPPSCLHALCCNCQEKLEITLPQIRQFLTSPTPSKKAFRLRCYSCSKISEFEPLKPDNTRPPQNAKEAPKAASKNTSGRKYGTDSNPLSTEYYDLLDVKPDATDKQIKVAYRLMAMKYHPDKNSSPEAEDTFKKLSEAYQVLSDPDLRRRYNQYGPQNGVSPEGGFIDPTEFFIKTFGGEKFSDLIGEISIARTFSEAINEGAEDENADPQNDEAKQKKVAEEQAKVREARVEKLVANLTKRLDVYVEEPMHQNAFEELARLEAEELKTESYGLELLHAIGYTYSLKARQYLGKDVIFGFPKFFQQVREKGHIISETVGTIRSAIDLQQSYNQLQEAEKAGNLDASGKAKLEELTAQKGLSAIWRTSKMEVQSVLRDVCDRVLGDPASPRLTLKRRAEGLKILGRVYESVKSDLEPPEAISSAERPKNDGQS